MVIKSSLNRNVACVLRGNKQTNKNVSLERRWERGRRSLERGGGEKPGNIGVGGVGWGAGLNGYAFPVIIQFWDVESRFAFAILLFNVLKESFVWAECLELRYVYVSLTTVFESNYKPCKGW